MNLRSSQQLALVSCLLAFGQCAHAESQLSIAASTPEIQVQPRAANAGFLRLPNVMFAFDIDAQCSRELQPLSLLINVADTRKTLSRNDFGNNALTLTLEIPADQIAPVAIRDFCVAPASSGESPDPDHGASSIRRLPAVLSAQASMRCGTATEESELEEQTPQDETVYASTPLDVMLTCANPASSTGDPIR